MPEIDLEELQRLIDADRKPASGSEEEYYLSEVARYARYMASSSASTAEHTAKLSSLAQQHAVILSDIRSSLGVIKWTLFILAVLGVQAMLIWAPKGWWHTPFWVYL